MTQITMEIDGMMCGMCESHVNDCIRRAFSVKKVTSSHSKGQTVIVTESDIPDQALEQAVGESGYRVTGISRKPFEKKGLFGFHK